MTESSSQPVIAQFYQSLPLPTGSRSIRVLELEPPTTQAADGGPLSGDLRIIDLDVAPAPSFSALSYVCGDIKDAPPSSTITLGVDRVSLQLTNNCLEALRHLRSLAKPLTIWVDAISIYQDDFEEKSHQIPLMGEIYARAETTFIWLGPADDPSTRAMKFLSSVGLVDYFFTPEQEKASSSVKPRPLLAARSLYWRSWTHLIHIRKAKRGDFVDIENQKSTSGRKYGHQNQNPFMVSRQMTTAPPVIDNGDLAHFLNCQYLYRLWTYQEVMLSENPVLVQGLLTISWWRFAMSILYLSRASGYSDDGAHYKLLQLWRSLILDRSRLHISSDQARGTSNQTTLDLKLYEGFLIDVAAHIDRLERVFGSRWDIRFPMIFFLLFVGGGACTFVAGVSTQPKYFSPVMCAGTVAGSLGLFGMIILSWSYLMCRIVRRPHRTEEDSARAYSAQTVVLSAIWSRQCSHAKDINFATRNIVRLFTGRDLPQLSYSSSLGEIYNDLTMNMLRLTESPELILAALRSCVQDAPSWTVDWSLREPLRTGQRKLEQSHGLFYDASARPMPPDSWRLDPIRPNVLQIRGRKLGLVTAVLGLKGFGIYGEYNEHAKHIHNLKILLGLEKAGGCYAIGQPEAFQRFLKKNRLQPAEEMVSWLWKPDQRPVTHTVSMTVERETRVSGSDATYVESVTYGSNVAATSIDLFEEYRSLCKQMEGSMFVAIGDAEPGTFNSAPLWPTPDTVAQLRLHSVYTARLYSTAAATDGYGGRSIAEDVSSSQPLDGCRVRPGDMVWQIPGLAEKAVIREDAGNLIFVDALEGETNPNHEEGDMQMIDIH